jgi:hypothetical protein
MAGKEPLPSRGTICYTGTSMSPTLMAGDRLDYQQQDTYRRGDVIVYPEPGQAERYIIHRIIRVNGDSLQTAGDHNWHADGYHLRRDQVIGRIVQKTRAGRKSLVWSGPRGALRYWYTRKGRRVLRCFYLPLAPAFDRLARRVSPLFSSFLAVQPVIVLSEDSSVSVWLCMHRWCAGWWDPPQKRWYIRPEFRLFLDPGRLPDCQELLLAQGIKPPSTIYRPETS